MVIVLYLPLTSGLQNFLIDSTQCYVDNLDPIQYHFVFDKNYFRKDEHYPYRKFLSYLYSYILLCGVGLDAVDVTQSYTNVFVVCVLYYKLSITLKICFLSILAIQTFNN